MRPRLAPVLGLIRACHPEPAVAVTLVGTLLALAVGLRGTGVLSVTFTVLASQLTVGWTNDALDASRDALVGRTDKPIPAGAVSLRAVVIGAVLSAVAVPPLALTLGWHAGLLMIVATAAGLAYDWPLKFTLASVLPYYVAFGALAAYVPAGHPGSPVPWWLVAAGALLGGGAHFANALPDLADDARTGVRGLPHRLGASGSAIAAAVQLLGATALLAFGPRPVSWTAGGLFAAAVIVLPIGWWLARTPGSRWAFRSVLVVALLDVLLLISNGSRL